MRLVLREGSYAIYHGSGIMNMYITRFSGTVYMSHEVTFHRHYSALLCESAVFSLSQAIDF